MATCSGKLEFSAVDSLLGIDAEQWNQLVDADDPFHEWGFLASLELSGVVGAGTSWQPAYLLAEKGGQLVGALASWIRYDSYGEFVFDRHWADAYQRAGLPYYPKLTVGLPFTPATTRRFLVHPDHPRRETAVGLIEHSLAFAVEQKLSGVHFLFVTEEEQQLLAEHDFMSRLQPEFLWRNSDYDDFDDFAGSLRSKKRKQVLLERRQVADGGLAIETLGGAQLTDADMDALWSFYHDTTGRKWGKRYLNRDTFENWRQRCAERVVVVLARDGDRAVAGTFNFYRGSMLYGRYWGAVENLPLMHFECCYYRLIDFAIERGLQSFDAGVQGEHKFLRGFEARPVYSAHWLSHPPARQAVGSYLKQEREQVRRVVDGYNRVSPLKTVRARAAEQAGVFKKP